jgi:hypothetical protein
MARTVWRLDLNTQYGAIMSEGKRHLLFALLGLLVIAAGTWWWFDTMEKRWTSFEMQSDAANTNTMLAATRLLTQHKQTVTNKSTLAEATLTTLPDGTLFLAANGGIITSEQTTQLLEWIRRGNTLIFTPKWSGRLRTTECGQAAGEITRDDEDEADLFDSDPFGAYLGVALENVTRGKDKSKAKDKEKDPDEEDEGLLDKILKKTSKWEPCLAKLTLPDTGYPLQLDVSHTVLSQSEKSAQPVISDETREAVHVYAEGKGQIVAIATNYFTNHQLNLLDNAELLLSLVQLNRNASNVLIIEHLDMPTWYQALWWNFKYVLISLGCGLLLLLWMGVRRFGPVLPEPNLERRSLMEHIDASGRWLWKVPGGRAILLAASRELLNRTLLRKAPELQRMQPNERAEVMTQHTKLPMTRILDAIDGPPYKHPFDFTQQIQTLHQLRKHYER